MNQKVAGSNPAGRTCKIRALNFRELTKEAITANQWLIRGLKYSLQTSVEAMVDIAYHISAKHIKAAPAGKQLSLSDPYLHYPKYVLEALHNSWVEPFSKTIFPNINEACFTQLYSEKHSRPNAPAAILRKC